VSKYFGFKHTSEIQTFIAVIWINLTCVYLIELLVAADFANISDCCPLSHLSHPVKTLQVMSWSHVANVFWHLRMRNTTKAPPTVWQRYACVDNLGMCHTLDQHVWALDLILLLLEVRHLTKRPWKFKQLACCICLQHLSDLMPLMLKSDILWYATTANPMMVNTIKHTAL